MTTEPTVAEKPLLRQSSIHTFLACQIRYFFAFLEGIKIPPKSALVVGKDFHKTLEVNYVQKVETHEDLPVADLKEFFAATFDEDIEAVEWSDKEKAEKVDVAKGRLKDTGVGCVEVYQEDVAPTIQPIELEQPFRIKFDNDFPYDLGGTTDMTAEIDDQGDKEQIDIFRPDGVVIVDNKTAGQSPVKNAAHKSLQLTIYTIGYRARTGLIERGCRLDSVVKNKKPKVVCQPTIRTNAQLQVGLNLIGRIAQNIEFVKQSGAFLSADPMWWGCSPEWCGFWNICEFGGKK